MKIRIHKRFRGLLSLLITVMLLVGVMPFSAVQVYSTNKQNITVYFANNMGWTGSGENWSGIRTPYVNYWYKKTDGNGYAKGVEAMTALSDETKLATGYNIYSFTVEIDLDSTNYGITFCSDANKEWESNSVTGSDLQNNYIYYVTSGYHSGSAPFGKIPYTDANYRPLSTIPTRSKDTSVATTNVPIDETDNNSTVYKDAVVYDYYSDYELNNVNKTKSQIDSATGGTYWCANLHTTEGYKWESALKYIPNLTLNKKLSDYYNAITDKSSLYPIYFGNLVEHGSGNFNFVDFNNKLATSSNNLWYNNRRELYYANSGLGRDTGSGNNETWTSGSSNNGKVAAQGLYGSQLSASGDLLLSDNTTVAPFFNAIWLTTNKVGADYSVKFPFFKVANGTYNDVLGNSGTIVADSNNEYWEYNSDNSGYAVRMTYSSADQKYHLKQTNQVVYSVKSEGIQNGQNDQGTHYGFYPFDDPISKTDHGKYIDKLNYNFGFEVTIPFTLPSNGTIDGTSGGKPITFEFEGDDDLVVYVDDYLALDIGGDHGAVAGMINFKTMTSTVSSVKSGGGKRDNASTNLSTVHSNALSGIRDGGIHTMKIFCMERGLFESNVRIRYNLPGVEEHKLKVEENVVLGTINENLYKLAGNTSNTSTITSNINANLKKVKFKMGLQFGESDTGTFGGYVNNGNATLENTAMTDNGMSGYYFNVTSTGTTNPMTYFNYFPKNSEYYIKISEIDNAHVYKGDTDTGKIVSDLFTCRWDFYKLDNSTATNTGTGFGPAKTTNTSSRPQRIVKTTSTSADNSTNSFKLEGTRATPDRVVFTNTLKKTSFQINKTISGRNYNDTNQPLTFKFQITFNNLGGLGLEDDPTTGNDVQIEPMEVTVTIPAGASNLSAVSTAIANIPVGTSYTIIEISDGSTTSGYTSNIPDGGKTGTVTETDTTNHVCVVGVGNTPDNPNAPEQPQEPQKIILKIQKVWGTTTVYPDELKFKVKKSGSDAGVTKVLNAAGTDITSSYNGTTHVLTMTETDNATTVTVDGATSTVWVAYIVDLGNTDINGTGGSAVTYTITELGDSDAELADQGTWTYTTGSGEEAVTTTFKVHYSFAAAGGGSNTGTYSGPVTATPTNFSTYESDYGESGGLRILTLSAMNSVVPEQTQTNTGGRGGYIPIAGGFIAILLAGAGYFMYRKRIFA